MLAVAWILRTLSGPAQFNSIFRVQPLALFEAKGPFHKSGIALRDTFSKRQAGAMRPVPRAGWVWAAGCSPAAKKLHGLSVRAQVRRIIASLSFSVAGVFPFLPPLRSAMRRGAWKCNAGPR